jgi:hypothetical protein
MGHAFAISIALWDFGANLVLAKKLAKTRFDWLGPWQEQLANLRFY